MSHTLNNYRVLFVILDWPKNGYLKVYFCIIFHFYSILKKTNFKLFEGIIVFKYPKCSVHTFLCSYVPQLLIGCLELNFLGSNDTQLPKRQVAGRYLRNTKILYCSCVKMVWRGQPEISGQPKSPYRKGNEESPAFHVLFLFSVDSVTEVCQLFLWRLKWEAGTSNTGHLQAASSASWWD